MRYLRVLFKKSQDALKRQFKNDKVNVASLKDSEKS